MKRTLLFIPFVILTLFISLASFSPVTSGLEEEVLSYTNQFRKSRGLPALTMQDDLNELARQHSADMARGRVAFGHDGFDQREARALKKINTAHRFAENVAYGANTAREVVAMWKGSAGHRKNMLGKYKYIGIGTAKDNRGVIYYTQFFVD